MIPPRTSGGNIPQGRVNCQTRAARAARAACMEKIYEIPRAGAARDQCASFFLINSTVRQRESLREVDLLEYNCILDLNLVPRYRCLEFLESVGEKNYCELIPKGVLLIVADGD
jgi:hypothetical protein